MQIQSGDTETLVINSSEILHCENYNAINNTYMNKLLIVSFKHLKMSTYSIVMDKP